MEMTVFSMDSKSEKQRTYFVKIDNINVPEYLKGTQVLEASSKDELFSAICERYGFQENHKNYLELWSGSLGHSGRERLDTYQEIPERYQDIWVRGVKRTQ